MNRKEIEKLVNEICNMPWRCPVHDVGADCDCNGAKGECQIKDALILAAKAQKANGGAK